MFKLLIIILQLVFLSQSHAIEPSGKFSFSYSKDAPLVDTGIFQILDQSFIFNAFFLNEEKAKKNIAYPLIVHTFNDDALVVNSTTVFGKAEHIRHYTTLTTPWGDGVLFADHGVDYQNYNKGGEIKLLVLNKKTKTLEDFSHKLNLARNYTFNVVALKQKGKKFHDILLTVGNTILSKPVYLESNDTGYLDKSFMLPSEWLSKKWCFMTGINLDIDLDGTDEVLIGGCDGQSLKDNPLTRDRILKLKSNKWSFLDREILPDRKGGKGWGTVYLLKDDLNNDGKLDVVALTHDWGFHTGQVQILIYKQRTKKFKEINIKNWPTADLLKSQHYLHRAVAFDIDGDGKKDIVGQFNFIDGNVVIKPNLFVLLNKGSYFKYTSEKYFSNKQEDFVIGIDLVKRKKSTKSDLFVTFYNGTVQIYRVQ